jgi:hypothetical protein
MIRAALAALALLCVSAIPSSSNLLMAPTVSATTHILLIQTGSALLIQTGSKFLIQ